MFGCAEKYTEQSTHCAMTTTTTKTTKTTMTANTSKTTLTSLTWTAFAILEMFSLSVSEQANKDLSKLNGS